MGQDAQPTGRGDPKALQFKSQLSASKLNESLPSLNLYSKDNSSPRPAVCWGGKCQTFGRCSVKGVIVSGGKHAWLFCTSRNSCLRHLYAEGWGGTCLHWSRLAS